MAENKESVSTEPPKKEEELKPAENPKKEEPEKTESAAPHAVPEAKDANGELIKNVTIL